MPYKYNPLEDDFDLIGKVPQYSSDPSSPAAEDAWVLLTSTGGAGGGTYKGTLGLGFPYLSPSTGGASTYALKYRTKEGTTKTFSGGTSGISEELAIAYSVAL